MSLRVDVGAAAEEQVQQAGTASSVGEAADTLDTAALIAVLDQLRREDETAVEAEAAAAAQDAVFSGPAFEVAAGEAGAQLDASSGTAAPAATAGGTAEKSGWLPRGFWPRALGTGAIVGLAVATDDDDDDNSNPADNRAPTITSNGAGTNANISLPENSTAVTTVAATDADGDRITYRISGGADASKFAIDASTGVLSFVSAPDYENPTDTGRDNVYNVIVTASDGRLSDTQAIAVTITNVNEEGNDPPVITSNGGAATAAINVAENSTAVTIVTAVDVDPDTTLTYSISGGADASKFTINSSSGVLRFVNAPDFEAPTDADANNKYIVIVSVSDGTATDTQTITVTVTDVFEPNNQAPVITSNGGEGTATVTVDENTTAVTQVTATDPNTADALSYSITGGADAAKFSINASTGELRFVNAPDFESPQDQDEDNRYEVTVTVSDGELTDSQTLTVVVDDVDEDNEAPVITSDGGGATAALTRTEGTETVTTVTADDPEDDTLDFSILGGADADLFSIDDVTGVLRFLEAPSFDDPQDDDGDNIYEVIVGVSDGSRNDSQTITITITETESEAAAAALAAPLDVAPLFNDPALTAL